MENLYDILIIGGGPGGYTAALYGARSGLRTAIVEKLSSGGQMALTSQIDNYPGFPDGIDGFELGEKMHQGAIRFGAESIIAEVTRVDLNKDPKCVYTTEGVLYSKTVIIATGAIPKELGFPDEAYYVGKGLNYCAHCDGMFYRNKKVVVIGGGNSAAADALLLSRICEEVIIIHRRDSLRATKIYHDPLYKADNISFRWNSEVKEIIFENRVKGLTILNKLTGSVETVACDGVFVSIGRKPVTDIFDDQIELDPDGYVIADESTKTNIQGVYAAGDVRTKALRQVVTAVSDGAVAAYQAENYIASKS